MAAFSTISSAKVVYPRTTISVTPGATPAVAVISGEDGWAVWTAGENEAPTISGTHVAGQLLILMIINDATPRTITFGSGFVALATVVGVTSKRSQLIFVSNGTSFYEVARTVGI